jgi:hypothetical protein
MVLKEVLLPLTGVMGLLPKAGIRPTSGARPTKEKTDCFKNDFLFMLSPEVNIIK